MSQDVQRNRLTPSNPQTGSEAYEFGPIAIDAARHRVTRDGRALALPPKTYELLLILVRSDGRALSRHDLMSALWPDTFVEEANLSFQVSTLRKTLGEGAEAWIETVPKLGYRFTPTVRTEPAAVAAATGALPPSPRPPADDRGEDAVQMLVPSRRAARRRLALAVVVLAALGAAVLVWRLAIGRRSAPEGPLVGTAATPLTAYIGTEGSPSFSPDGAQVAFHWNGPQQDNVDVYVKTVGGGEPVRLTSDPEREVAPAWSPDGSRLAFLKVQADQTATDVMVMPALGGTVRRIASVVTFTSAGVLESAGGLLAWSPDSRWIAVGGTIGSEPGIWLIASDGSTRRRLTTDGSLPEWGPAFTSDGRRLAFIRESLISQSGVFVVPLDTEMRPTGPPVKVVEAAPRRVLALAWEPGDRGLVYSVSSHMASSQLRRMRLDAKGAPVPSSGEALLVGDQGTGLDITASGRMVYARRFRDTGFWRLDLTQPGAGFDDSGLPASTLDEHTPDYSPDGSKLAFTSTRSGSEEIWISQADGSHARQMTSMGGPLCSNPRWSPDGRAVVFDSTSRGVRHLYRLDVGTAEVRQLTTGSVRHHQARWSRDGRSIYFGAYSDEGPHSPVEIRRMPADGGPSVRITPGSVAEPSHDGRWLFVARSDDDQTTLWRLRLPDGQPELLRRGIVHESSFAVGRQSVFVVEQGRPASMIISEIDIATGQRREVAALSKRRWWGLALSPDERYLIVPAINEAGSDLMMVEPVR